MSSEESTSLTQAHVQRSFREYSQALSNKLQDDASENQKRLLQGILSNPLKFAVLDMKTLDLQLLHIRNAVQAIFSTLSVSQLEQACTVTPPEALRSVSTIALITKRVMQSFHCWPNLSQNEHRDNYLAQLLCCAREQKDPKTALWIARKIKNSSMQDQYFREIHRDVIDFTNLDLAVSIAKQIKNNDLRQSALIETAVRFLDQGDHEQALALRSWTKDSTPILLETMIFFGKQAQFAQTKKLALLIEPPRRGEVFQAFVSRCIRENHLNAATHFLPWVNNYAINRVLAESIQRARLLNQART